MEKVNNGSLYDIRVAFGEVVRLKRQERGFSQEDFADICGLHRTYISEIERGKRNVSLENIQVIAYGLSISLSDLFREVAKRGQEYES